MYEHMQTVGKDCGHVQTVGKDCGHIQTVGNDYGHVQTIGILEFFKEQTDRMNI